MGKKTVRKDTKILYSPFRPKWTLGSNSSEKAYGTAKRLVIACDCGSNPPCKLSQRETVGILCGSIPHLPKMRNSTLYLCGEQTVTGGTKKLSYRKENAGNWSCIKCNSFHHLKVMGFLAKLFMKRLNLQIDLTENEAFDKEVEEIIRAKARELARNEHSKKISEEISEEVSAEVKRLADGNSWGYRDKLESMVKEMTRDELKRVISDMEVENIAKQYVKDHIEYIMSKITNDVERKCKDVLDDVVNNAVQEKLKDILK